MMMIGIGIKIRDVVIKVNLMQETNFAELVQGVVNGRQRHIDAFVFRFKPKLFRGDMAARAIEQQIRQSKPLAGWAQMKLT